MMFTITTYNFIWHKRIKALIEIPAYVVGNWGFYLLFDPKFQLWKDEFRGRNITWSNPNKTVHT